MYMRNLRNGRSAPHGHAQRVFWRSRINLRPYGYDVLLHMSSTMMRERFDKLKKSTTRGTRVSLEMRQLIVSIFDVNPDPLKLMRVDLCMDIRGVDLGWFKRHTIVRSKQTNS